MSRINPGFTPAPLFSAVKARPAAMPYFRGDDVSGGDEPATDKAKSGCGDSCGCGSDISTGKKKRSLKDRFLLPLLIATTLLSSTAAAGSVGTFLVLNQIKDDTAPLVEASKNLPTAEEIQKIQDDFDKLGDNLPTKEEMDRLNRVIEQIETFLNASGTSTEAQGTDSPNLIDQLQTLLELREALGGGS